MGSALHWKAKYGGLTVRKRSGRKLALEILAPMAIAQETSDGRSRPLDKLAKSFVSDALACGRQLRLRDESLPLRQEPVRSGPPESNLFAGITQSVNRFGLGRPYPFVFFRRFGGVGLDIGGE